VFAIAILAGEGGQIQRCPEGILKIGLYRRQENS
jgi:hypothetical protein